MSVNAKKTKPVKKEAAPVSEKPAKPEKKEYVRKPITVVKKTPKIGRAHV